MKNKIYKIYRGPALSERSESNGFTLFVAIIVMGTLLLIATGIVSLAVRQALTSASGRESQYAFYAADTGIECALYWDVKNATGISAFATSTSSNITCNDIFATVGGGGNSSPTSIFSFTLTPEPHCAIVAVTKFYVGSVLRTTIESKGYNTCDTSNLRRVERAVRATY